MAVHCAQRISTCSNPNSKMTISLQTITLYNFKSYMGEIIMGPFHPFMTIVGPNGCGKSNIVDAVRFVLGEVLNALRVKRFSELVYGGSIGKPTTGSTYVTLTFLVDDNKEESFTRMIQGENSQYKINNKVVTSEFYMTTLQNYGLDIKSNHFLVTQNYVECIAMKTPKELNAVFERISGSYVYKADYKRLKMKLAQMEDQIQFAQHMKKQLLMNKKHIVIEKEEAERYLKLQEQYVRQAKKEKLQYQLIRLFLIKKTVKTLQDEYRDIKSRKGEYLRDKRNAMIVLERKNLQFKLFINSLENLEQEILELENIIQEQKVQYTVLKEGISYWQKKRDCARISLESASLARDTNKKTIEELKNELKQIAKKLVEFKKVSEQGAIELSDSQIKQYFELKNTVECQAKDFVNQINSLIRDQEVDRDRLDNENRRKQELEDKVKQTALMKENMKIRLRKLQNIIAESRVMLTEKATKKKELDDKITETNNKSLSLKNDIAQILEALNDVDVNNYTISWQKKKIETIKILKQLFPGVHDRLSNLCKPVHSRYKIAVIKVFGKLIDAIIVDTTNTAMQCMKFLKLQKIGVETFLPLDSLKQEVLKERLRDVGGPNVKLLYDILNISSPQINKAVLFVTKSTLVCETPEDARRVAYEIDRKTHDCVSLDGSFYRKDGIVSGGLTDLINKAKQWEERDIIALKEQREKLKKEFQDLPNVSLLQSELGIIDAQFKGLSLKKNFIEKDLKDTEDEITRVNEESIEYDTELSLSNKKISKIQRDMQARNEKLENVKRHVSAIENSVFADFCRNINVPDIGYYEKNHLWTYQEQKKRQIELENQHDLIQNQLRFEKNRNMENKILNGIRIVEQANTKLIEMHQQEHSTKKAVEQEEKKLSKLQEDRAIVKENLVNAENKIAQCKSQIDVISKLYLETQRMDIIVQRKIGQQKAECDNILKECKMEDITIPILSEKSSGKLDPSSSSSFTDSSIDWDISKSKIDFSQFPISIPDSTEENLQDIVKQLSEKLTQIQNELEVIVNPNLKAQENMDSVMQEIQELNKKLKKSREETNKIKKQFEAVKMKRFNLFSECLDCVAAEIDSAYKSLVNHTSASAFILPDNPEEPYEGGINYSCIAPSKCFQPLQNLSGGEKTLAGLALLFAFQRYKPAPFFIMDESDAALDNANIKNVIRFIRSQADTTQFIIVSLQKLLYFCSDALIGVTTEPDAEYTQSKVVAISLRKYKDKSDVKKDEI